MCKAGQPERLKGKGRAVRVRGETNSRGCTCDQRDLASRRRALEIKWLFSEMEEVRFIGGASPSRYSRDVARRVGTRRYFEVAPFK